MQTTIHHIKSFIKKSLLCSAVLVLGSFSATPFTLTASADCDPTPPADSSYGSGVHHPTGADSGTFSYDCNSGTWSNAYYIYYPVSNTRAATYSPNYSYDCTTGRWTMDEYAYSSGDSSYHLRRVTAPDPGLPTGCPAPAATDPGSGGSSISGTGPGSTNTTDNGVTLNNSTTNNNQLGMSNTIFSDANTGNTFVIGNTHGGSATSGDATSIATIANLLQSSTNVFGPGVTTFTADINGDVTGDFMFDPSALISDTGPNSTNAANNDLTVNSTDDTTTNAQIHNTINVGANSGNATVADNTNGGDATSGNATAIVNLMNLINSTVAAGHSFVGTININGNLNGDILLPQGLVDQLLANTGANSNNVANTNVTDNSQTTNNVNESIANNVQTTAVSGDARVSGNTNAGDATTGNGNTNVTLLNLTGSNVVGKNDLLVFVNVLGHWVGLIMNAPSGSTAAELGGGITGTGPGSNDSTNTNVTDNSSSTNNVTEGIVNDVNAHSQTGNATVTDNTNAGSARSGNANTAVNILNLEGSNLNLSNWFGVLFINVLGNWNGSFGVNTSAGDPVANPTNNSVQAANQEQMVKQFKQFANFAAGSGSGSGIATTSSTTASVLGSTTSVAKKIAASSTTTPSIASSTHANFLLPAVGVIIAAILLFASERGRFFGRKG